MQQKNLKQQEKEVEFSTDIPSKIFIDADAFVAIANEKDPNHLYAITASQVLVRYKVMLYTSGYAFGEAVTVVSQKVGHEMASRMGDDILKSNIKIIDINSFQRQKAHNKFKQQRSKNSRFTDIINMIIMDELKIKTIFSFDKHYPQNGYNLFS